MNYAAQHQRWTGTSLCRSALMTRSALLDSRVRVHPRQFSPKATGDWYQPHQGDGLPAVSPREYALPYWLSRL